MKTVFTQLNEQNFKENLQEQKKRLFKEFIYYKIIDLFISYVIQI
jgi:hypothetical protein